MEQNTIQTYKKSDYLSATQTAKKYNLDPQKTYDLMLSLYKSRTPFTYTSRNSEITNVIVVKFSHSTSSTGKYPLRLHPLAEQLFLQKYNKRYDAAEQMNVGTQILNAKTRVAKIQKTKNNVIKTDTKEK